jgi:hypothetical protein
LTYKSGSGDALSVETADRDDGEHLYQRSCTSVAFETFLNYVYLHKMFLGGEEDMFRGNVRFEVIMAVTMKNAVFWDVTLRGSCKNRRFGGT